MEIELSKTLLSVGNRDDHTDLVVNEQLATQAVRAMRGLHNLHDFARSSGEHGAIRHLIAGINELAEIIVTSAVSQDSTSPFNMSKISAAKLNVDYAEQGMQEAIEVHTRNKTRPLSDSDGNTLLHLAQTLDGVISACLLMKTDPEYSPGDRTESRFSSALVMACSIARAHDALPAQ